MGTDNQLRNLPPYENPPRWIPPNERDEHPDYCSDIENFLPRNISLQRSTTSEQLGFNIRGGKEHNCGIYISKVMRNSEADRLGLQEGDQIIAVNDVNFESIDHGEVMTEPMTKVDTHLNRALLPVDNTELNYKCI